jgi:hypothetical protein
MGVHLPQISVGRFIDVILLKQSLLISLLD